MSFGALDLRGTELGEQGFDLVVVPARPAVPVFLMGRGAEVWLMIAQGRGGELETDEEALEVLSSLEEMGIASREPGHSAQLQGVTQPWLVSPIHELVYALLAHVAAAHDIEILFIKGPALHAQGLRSRQHSGDVDCWVQPGDDLRLAEAMRSWGWKPLYSPFTGTGVTHSLTLDAGDWGCAIDVHTRFPGIDSPPHASFDIVRAESEPRVFASTSCLTPRVALHGIVAALHAVRPFVGSPAGAAELEEASAVLRAAGVETIELAERVNAVYALEEPLRRAFPAEARSYESARPPADWGWRLTASAPRRHLRALRTVPLRKKPAVILRLLWPTDAMMEAAGEAPGTSWRRKAATRVQRVAAAVRRLLAMR